MTHLGHDKISYILFVNPNLEIIKRSVNESLDRLQKFTGAHAESSQAKLFSRLHEHNNNNHPIRLILLFSLLNIDEVLCTQTMSTTEIETRSNLKSMCKHKASFFLPLLKTVIDEWLQNEEISLNAAIQKIEDVYLCS